jgi:thioredoxin-dependent peroxiredoxin
MRNRLVVSVIGLLALLGAAHARAVEVGQKAPDFELQGTDGKVHRLADFVGKRGFVLAWFPKAFTSGCTAELASLDASADALAGYDVAVFMVSTDTPEKNAEFAKATGPRQVLLSDPEGEAAGAYGVAGLGGLYSKRWTFYVDRDGVVRGVDQAVETETAGSDILKKLDELGFPKKR